MAGGTDFPRAGLHVAIATGAAVLTRSVFLVAVASLIAGCQSPEAFRASAFSQDATATLDQSGSGGAAGTFEATGGSGGSLYGSGGSGGDGTGSGGSIDAGSGGTGAVDAGGGGEVASGNGSGGSVQPDAPVDMADAGPMDTPPEVNPYCQSTKWTATASVSSATGISRPANGIDGDLTTRWGNQRLQDGTDWYQVDFGGMIRLDAITLDNTQTYPGDYPGAYSVQGSTDGTTFGAAFVTGNGTDGKTVIKFPPQTVRAIKINQTGNSHRLWWQIGELQIHCP